MTTPSPEQQARDAIERRRRSNGHLVPIRNVRIENFRGIRHLSIALDPNVTVFFGVNAAGKTTILDAIAIGLGAYVTQFPRAKGMTFAKRGDVRVPWVEWIPPSEGPDWEASPEEVGIGTERPGGERPFARVTIEASSGVSWDATKLRWKGEPAKKPGLGTKYLRQFLEPLILAALERADATAVFHQPIPRVAAYGPQRAVVDVPLRRRDFKNEFERFGALNESLRTNTRFKTVFEWFVVAEDEERRMVQLNPSDDLSAPDRGANSEGVILIDEIDLHLDPTWQATVVKGLRDAFPRVQFVVTTHSEQVITGSGPQSAAPWARSLSRG